MHADRTLKPLRRGWLAIAGLVALLAVVGLIGDRPVSTLPAVLPVVLVVTVGAGCLALIVAWWRGLRAATPIDRSDALAALRNRQALQLATALAPVLIGAGLATVFGHRATIVAATSVGAMAIVLGFPSARRIRGIDTAWQARGVDVTILSGAGDE